MKISNILFAWMAAFLLPTNSLRSINSPLVVSAYENNSCPYTSHDGNQQMISPWDWSGVQWSENLETITTALGSALFPEFGAAFSVAGAIWTIVDNSIDNQENFISKLMKIIYAIIEQELDSVEEGQINSYMDTAADNLNLFASATVDRCQFLEGALNSVDQAKNAIMEYPGNERVFAPYLLQVGSLHLSVLRDMILNGTDPSVCCDYDAQTGECGGNAAAYASQQQSLYTFYYTNIANLTSNWATWRESELTSKSTSNGHEFKDNYLPMECKFKSEGSERSSETKNVFLQEQVMAMMAMIKPIIYLHRYIPGRENDGPVWPDDIDGAKVYPMTVLTDGIWTGNYRGYNDCGASGKHDQSCTYLAGDRSSESYKNVQDTPGIITELHVSAYNTLDYMYAVYSTGKGKAVEKDKPSGNWIVYNVNDYSNDGWVQSVEWWMLWGSTNEQVAAIRPTFNNTDNQLVTAQRWGGKNDPFLTMTLSMGSGWFLAGMKYQGPTSGPSGTDPIAGIGGFFYILERMSDLESEAATSPEAHFCNSLPCRRHHM
mmetsp:Transcript_8961/g.24846  ORF Transcript_8961/g.24846 Transcript_8961/m.24846 type:complete len:545 (+) Transcript_8961:122-1756(+)|eukprot:CAMPEP_0168719452 /NCGR_PEP_ID=MMETSP0724-20121128/1045_1 /TAXON_ID=265536 /ORGANISM="Amphiprora sp., Strain CCMP467" /LENGTH=544 /DNA_ID=CAMNT_0008766005 /DNA_START=68 /DNA_END=1702 /DNA_ORIENTATION=-